MLIKLISILDFKWIDRRYAEFNYRSENVDKLKKCMRMKSFKAVRESIKSEWMHKYWMETVRLSTEKSLNRWPITITVIMARPLLHKWVEITTHWALVNTLLRANFLYLRDNCGYHQNSFNNVPNRSPCSVIKGCLIDSGSKKRNIFERNSFLFCKG